MSAPVVDLNIALKCPDCKIIPPNISEEFSSGDLVCADCGLVLGDRIVDTRSEWRTFANDEGDDPSRVGSAANPLLNGPQLDTIISQKDGGSGASKDLNRTHGRVTAVKGERNLLQAYKDISAMCEAIGLPKLVSDIAKQIFKRAEDEKLLRGKPTENVIAACIFIACRQEGVHRTFKEIEALTQVSKKEISRCFKVLSDNFQETKVPATASEDLIARFCNNLGLTMDVEKAAVELTKKAKDIMTLNGKAPASIAAACVFMAATLFKNVRTTAVISMVCGVSEVTIKNAYKHLYKERATLVDQKLPAELIESLPSP
ncbi:transcription initiation factor IIB [Mortierella sp. GBA35]|nr:transcription initiation factor IIB [Mortierella sp. AD031]KAF9103023.1 transcription initiation factor IIB [Mortierella sp. GBA35]KAG0214566.1 transcription initiation factor IIB [Mortierella sp. NVP41]